MREATPDDAELLEELENEIFEDGLNALSLRGEVERGRAWIEEVDGEAAGYLLARIDDDLIDIIRLGVRLTYRGRGVASRLLHCALVQVPRAVLTVKKDNESAIALYSKFDFRIVGETSGRWVMLRCKTFRTHER